MKGGYNNGTNSSAAPILAYTALSQARINDSNYTTKNRSSKSEYFKAGDIDFERGYNASVNSTGITSKGQGMPRFRKSIDVHNASDKGYALAGAREGSFQSSDNKTGEYFYNNGAGGGASNAGRPKNKPKTEGNKEKYGYDDPNCADDEALYGRSTHRHIDEGMFSPNTFGMFSRPHIGFRDSQDGGVSAKTVYSGEECFDMSRSVIKCAQKMCDPDKPQVIKVHLVTNNASWQPTQKGMQVIQDMLNEEMGNAVGVQFVYHPTNHDIPDDGIKVDVGFYGKVVSSNGERVKGQAKLRFLSDSFMDISVDSIDDKYTKEFCSKNANQNKGTWVFPESDIDTYEMIGTLYHELFHAIIQSGHVDGKAFKKAVHVGNVTVDGHEQDCWKLEPADASYNDGSVYGSRGSIMHTSKTYSKSIKRRGLDGQDVLNIGGTLGFNKDHFTAEKQLGQGVFTSVFNLSSDAPIVAEKCRPKDGHATTVSPSRAFVVIDASDCFSGKNDTGCYNCTSVLGEKPFDANMRPRKDAALRTTESRYPNDEYYKDLPKGVQMFVATPQAALFGHCNFIVKGVQAGKDSEPITIHASVHVNAPEEGVDKEYGKYESILSYVVDSYDPAHATKCAVKTYPEGDESESHVQARVQAVTKMLQTAAMEAYKSVGGDLCERFAVGNSIKDSANLEVAVNFVEHSGERLKECLSKGDREGFSVSNVINELTKIIKDKEAEIASATNPAREPVRFTTTHATKEENETAKAIYDDIEKSINVTTELSFSSKAVIVSASAVASGIATACALYFARSVVKKMKEESLSVSDVEQSGDDLSANNNRSRVAASDGVEEIGMSELRPLTNCSIAVAEFVDENEEIASLHSASSRGSARLDDRRGAPEGGSKIYKTKECKAQRKYMNRDLQRKRDEKSSFLRY